MKTKKRTEITIERRRVLILRQRRSAKLGWCEVCRAQVSMLTPDEAAAVASVTTRTIYRQIEAGQVHFTETPTGGLSVCSKSLN